MTPRPPEPAPADPLEEGTDYLYCPICGAHAPCRPTPDGGWESWHGPMPEGEAKVREPEAGPAPKGRS